MNEGCGELGEACEAWGRVLEDVVREGRRKLERKVPERCVQPIQDKIRALERKMGYLE